LSRNLGTLTSWNPLGYSRPVTGLFYLFIRDEERLQWVGHIETIDDSRILQKGMGKCFGRRRVVGKPRERWVGGVLRNATNVIQIRNWQVAAR
jgi:hypothetical protein